MTITEEATAEGMIAAYANDSVEPFAHIARPSVLGYRVGASAFNTCASDGFNVLPRFPIIPPTSPLQFHFYSGDTNTHDAIIQQGANSTRDHPNAPDQMTADIHMILNGRLEESMPPRVSEPDPRIESAIGPASKPALPILPKTCKWEGCQYVHPFGREVDLMRHLKTVHVSPAAYICPEQGCGKLCSRKDNLEAHRQRVHARVNQRKSSSLSKFRRKR